MRFSVNSEVPVQARHLPIALISNFYIYGSLVATTIANSEVNHDEKTCMSEEDVKRPTRLAPKWWTMRCPGKGRKMG